MLKIINENAILNESTERENTIYHAQSDYIIYMHTMYVLSFVFHFYLDKNETINYFKTVKVVRSMG